MNINIQIKPKARTTRDPKGRKAPRNVFSGENDSDDDSSKKADYKSTQLTKKASISVTQQHRSAVNRSIAQEQEALYQQQAKTTVEYDFDGTYEASHAQQGSPSVATKNEDDKKSRYIGDLLKAAERRKRTHDLVYERNIAREQAQEEEDDPELRGKDRFITTSYKKKLQEQKQWKAKEEEEEREEEKNNVTKRGTMAHFYGNFSRNVAVGGKAKNQSPSPDTDNPSFSNGFKKGEEIEDFSQKETGSQFATVDVPEDDEVTQNMSKTHVTTEQRRLRQRKERAERVARARDRYILRHPSLATS